MTSIMTSKNKLGMYKSIKKPKKTKRTFNIHDRLSTINTTNTILNQTSVSEPDLSIKLHRDYFLGVFITGDVIQRLLQNKIILEDEILVEDQCVPLSMYLLARSISENSSYYEEYSLNELTGVGQTTFSKKPSEVVQDIFPSVDVMGQQCDTLFNKNKFYTAVYGTDSPDLAIGIVSTIILPFLKRYPTREYKQDYIIIPVGYDIIRDKTNVGEGHQLLMVVNLNKLYDLNKHNLIDHVNEFVSFIDNLYDGQVSYDVWSTNLQATFSKRVNKWLNPPKPYTGLSSTDKPLPSWGPKRRTHNAEDISKWLEDKRLANEDSYYLVMDSLISRTSSFALASVNIVGALIKSKKKNKKKRSKKNKSKKKKSKKKKSKKNKSKKNKSKK